MGKKLSDNQKTLMLAMISDFEELEQTFEVRNLTQIIMEVYNAGKYMDNQTEILNGIRDLWKRKIYDEGNSCWDYLQNGTLLNK